jgi:serine/threonine-protein kinase RsbW
MTIIKPYEKGAFLARDTMNFSKVIPSRLEIIPELVHAAVEKIGQQPLDEKQVHDITLSLEEALVNAVKHGNKSSQDLSVRLDIQTQGDSLVMTVADQGAGFDFSNVTDPTQPENLHKLSGRGIYLIRNLMDAVEFLDRGRKIKMTKFLRKGGPK